MTRISLAALGAVIALGACTSPEITPRADNFDTFGSGFSEANDYTPPNLLVRGLKITLCGFQQWDLAKVPL